MATRYERNRAARRLDIDRRTLGETLAEFHAKENPVRTAPGAGIPRARCEQTPNLFTGRTDAEIKRPPGLFDEPSRS